MVALKRDMARIYVIDEGEKQERRGGIETTVGLLMVHPC